MGNPVFYKHIRMEPFFMIKTSVFMILDSAQDWGDGGLTHDSKDNHRPRA